MRQSFVSWLVMLGTVILFVSFVQYAIEQTFGP